MLLVGAAGTTDQTREWMLSFFNSICMPGTSQSSIFDAQDLHNLLNQQHQLHALQPPWPLLQTGHMHFGEKADYKSDITAYNTYHEEPKKKSQPHHRH